MKDYIKKIIIQKLVGLAGILGSIWWVWDASNATNLIDKDGTALVILIPISLFLLITNKAVIDLD